MREIDKILLSVMKSAIGNGKSDDTIELTENQWFELFSISKKQGVAAIAFEEIILHRNNMPFNVKMEWAFHSRYIMERHEKQLVATAHFAEILKGKGIRMLLLKGNGLALLYPHPEFRECGDIDIYCFDDYNAVNQLVNEIGLAVDSEDEKHSHFVFEGIAIENHRRFNYDFNDANRVVSRELLNSFDKDLLTDERIPNVYFTNLNINALYIMQHSLNHLPWSGLPLRNLLDWMLFLMKNHAFLDWDYLDGIWKESKEKEIVSILTQYCIDFLGMPAECFHIGIEYDTSNYDVILDQILNPWVKSSETSNKFVKLLRKIDQYERRKKSHRIVYKEPFPDSVWKTFFKNRIS